MIEGEGEALVMMFSQRSLRALRLPRAPRPLRLQGQSMIEYAVLIAVTAAALTGMAVYTKRALNGKWRQVGDTFGFGRQYERCVTLIDGATEPGC